MDGKTEQANTFLWVLRGLTTVFLLGYLVSVYFAVFLYGWFPTGNLAEDLLGIGLLLLAGLGYYCMWMRKEVLSGILFIIWYAALWPAEILVGGETFVDSPAPGILLFILGILFLVYRAGAEKRKGKSNQPEK